MEKTYTSLRGVITTTRTYRSLGQQDREAIIYQYLKHGSAWVRKTWNISTQTLHHVRWHNKKIEADFEEKNFQEQSL